MNLFQTCPSCQTLSDSRSPYCWKCHAALIEAASPPVMTSENEAARIHQEVEKRKKRARDLGLPELFVDLFEEVRHYPECFEDPGGQQYLCPLVTAAARLSPEEIQLTINENDYVLEQKSRSFNTAGGEWCTLSDFTLYSNGKKVFGLHMAKEDHDGCHEIWTAFEVEAFIEGDWVGDFQEFKSELRKQKKESGEGFEWSDKLKGHFGL